MLRAAVFVVLIASAGLFAGGPAAHAAPSTTVVISQAYGGGGNLGAVYTHDFVELHNVGSTTVDLSAYALQYASATGSNWSVLPLSGTIRAGRYYLIQLASSGAAGSQLPLPDLSTTSINMSRSAGKLALARTTSAFAVSCPVAVADVVDFVGYGSTATCYEGTGPAPTPQPPNEAGDARPGAGCVDTDDNASDFISAPPAPRNSASADSYCAPDGAPAVAAATPADGATEVSVGSNISIGFNEPVTASGTWYEISCSSTGTHAATVQSSDSTSFTLDPTADFAPLERCVVTVSAAAVSDLDENDPPDTMTSDYSFSFTVGVGPPAQYLVSVSDTSLAAGASVTVRAQLADSLGNAVPQAERTVLWSSSGAGGSLSATSSETDATGVATVELSTSQTAGRSHTVTAVDAGDDTVTGTTAPFTTVPGPADHLVCGPVPDNVVSGTSARVEVEVEDANGNTVTTEFGRTVQLSQTGPGTVIWTSRTPVTVDGVASTSLTGRTAGAVTITAASGALAACSRSFTVVPGPGTRLIFVASPAAVPFGAEATLSVEVRDANQNKVVSDSGRAISFGQSAGSGSLSGLGTVFTSGGSASARVTGTGNGSITVTASATDLTGAATSFPVLAPDGSGTLSTTVVRVPNGSSGNTIAFIYRAAAGGVANGEIAIEVPAGWSRPSTAAGSPGFVTAGTGSVSISSRTIVVSQLTLGGGGRVTVVYGSTASGSPGATSPTAGGPQSWQGAGRASAVGSLQPLASSPSINVLAPDGSGTFSVRPGSVRARAAGLTVTFTYLAATGGIFDGALKVVVPPGWSAPSTLPTDPGFVTARTGSVSIAGREILVSGISVASGQTTGIVYGSKTGGGPGASAPSDAVGTQAWTASSRASSAGALALLAASPAISVTP